ncbi:MAG: ABC transporter permease [Spirulinaceae cyanobacterium]
MKTIFANVIAIYRRELQSYFASPFAYIVAGIFWLLSGFFYVYILFAPEAGLIQAAAAKDQTGFPPGALDVAYEFLRAFLTVLGSLIVFLLPLLSMGLYAEERKQGTLELLATSPLTNWAIAVGKLLGVVTFFITMTIPLLIYETITLSAAEPPVQPGVTLVSHLGLILLAAAILSLGMFVSSLTDSSIIAAVVTFALIFLLWIIDLIGESIPGPVGDILEHLSLLKHYNNLVQGIFDTGSVVLLISYIFLGVFLTAQSIEAFRFQRS